MTWTEEPDLRSQARRLWERGELLRPLAVGEPFEPRRLVLKGPTSAELAPKFEQVRAWIAALRAVPHVRVVWRELNHRLVGNQSLPCEVWVDTLDDALALAGASKDAARFAALVRLTADREPLLLPYLRAKALKSLALDDRWATLLDVVAWMKEHPRSGLYPRQVDIPGLHTKFIEQNASTISDLMAYVREGSVGAETSNRSFCRRFGLAERPEHVRFRALDPYVSPLPGLPAADLWLDAQSFAMLSTPAHRVIITENETNFLSLPPAKGAIAVFGAGYGFTALGQAAWLRERDVVYWGDIDTHGFAILSQLRSKLPQVRSVLMDHETLMAHEEFWVEEHEPTDAVISRLTAAELELYEILRLGRIKPRLRLEQERIGFQWAARSLEQTWVAN